MNNIAKYRKLKKMSQVQLAKLVGAAQNTVSNWENGNREPDNLTLVRLSEILDAPIENLLGAEVALPKHPKGIKIPVLGIVPAGIPLEAIEDILDYEEISEDMAAAGEYFGLKIKGDSMLPAICDGDIVIVRRQPDVDSGETAIVMVNGDEATCKKVYKQENGISLVPNNPTYEPRFFTNKEINSTPVRVIGKVVELRRKF